MNPTLYAEWIERGGPQDKADKYELKLLLADNLTDRIFYATNFILEQEVEDDRETELGLSSAVGMTIIERKLMAGMELVYQSDTLKSNRNDSTRFSDLAPACSGGSAIDGSWTWWDCSTPIGTRRLKCISCWATSSVTVPGRYRATRVGRFRRAGISEGGRADYFRRKWTGNWAVLSTGKPSRLAGLPIQCPMAPAASLSSTA